MRLEISKAEVQLCLAAKNIRKPLFTKDDLVGFGQMAFKDELEDWSAASYSFCHRNLFRVDGDHYSLTLARALSANGLAFTAHDFTASNLAFWRKSQEIIAEMKPEFEAEGNKDLCEGRIVEGDSVLALAVAARMSRYLYHARVSG